MGKKRTKRRLWFTPEEQKRGRKPKTRCRHRWASCDSQGYIICAKCRKRAIDVYGLMSQKYMRIERQWILKHRKPKGKNAQLGVIH